MPQAEATLAVIQDPDSLEELEQEPGEPAGEPSPETDATPDEPPAAEDEASAEQPADDSAAPAPPTDGPARDATGKFVAKDPAAQVAPPAPAPSPAEPSPPFSFRVDGKTVAVEGASEKDGVISMPRQAWDREVQNRLADRGKIQQVQERLQTRNRQLESEATAREERFKTVMGKVDALFQDKNRLKTFYERYELEAPRFMLEVENALLKNGQKRVETDQQARQQEAEEREFNDNAPTALGSAVDMVVDRLAKGQNVDRNAIVTELQDLWDAGVPIFFRVTEGDGSGLDPKEHKWGVDLARVERLAKPYISLHAKSAAVTKADAVEAANRTATARVAPKAPPVAPASGSPTPGGEAKYPTNREEYLKWKEQRSQEVGLPI